jgi:hypothetical protein
MAYVRSFCLHSLLKVRTLKNLRVSAGIFNTMALALFGLGVSTLSCMAQSCPVNTPHIQGVWRTLPYLMLINPISATLLHTGKILIVAGSENDASNNSKGSESYRNAIWDPRDPTANGITVQEIEYDVFCSGTAALPDGRALVIGGTSDYSIKGDNRASIFDPATTQFVQSQSMVNGRWYGSATTLGDGRVMAFAGLDLIIRQRIRRMTCTPHEHRSWAVVGIAGTCKFWNLPQDFHLQHFFILTVRLHRAYEEFLKPSAHA